MRDRIVVALNLITLLVGIFVGFALGRSSSASVEAQAAPPPITTAAQERTQARPPAPEQPNPNFEEITPVMTAGSAAFGVLLSSRMATDELSVKGVDVIKLIENTLNLMSTKRSVFTSAELQDVINKSKIARPLRMKQATAGRGGQ